MKIDKGLHLVVPIYDDDEGKVASTYIHSTPLPAEVVDRHWLTLSQTFAQIFTQGLGRAAGPAVAMRMLIQIGENAKAMDGPTGVRALIEEIRRLTVAIVPAKDGGWQQVPLQIAVQQGLISDEDRREVENVVVFFMASSATLPRAQRRPMLEAAAELWGALVSSSTPMEWIASLRTSTETGSFGEKSPAPVPAQPAPATATVDGKPASVPH